VYHYTDWTNNATFNHNSRSLRRAYYVNVGVQLMRELEKVVRPNVVHFSFIDPTTSLGQLRTLRYAAFVMTVITMMMMMMMAVAAPAFTDWDH